MLTFRAGAAGRSFAAGSMADYLTKIKEIGQRVGLSEYYAAKTGRIGVDVDPGIAALLALPMDRAVTRDELRNILYGLRADGSEIPGASGQQSTDKKVRVAYYDLTFSAPKHLSLAIAFAPTERERELLDSCHTDAVASTMKYIESQAAFARRGAQGRKGTEPGSMAWLTFEDFTARPTIKLPDGQDTYIGSVETAGDPDRHTHTILATPILTASGHVGSVHARTAIAGRVHEYGKIYQAFLATNMRKLGVEAVLDKDTGMAKIESVPRWAVDLFSKRTREGDEAAREWAKQDGKDWDALDSRAKIAFLKTGASSTRERKDDGVPDLESWQKQALEAGYRHASVLRPGQEKRPEDARVRREAAYHTSLPRLDDELQRRSKFEGTIARCAAVEGLIEHGIVDAGPDIYAITQAYRTEGVLQDGTVTALRWGRDIVQDENGELHIAKFASFTTDAHIQQEREVVDLIKAAGNNKSGILTREDIDAAADRVSRKTGFRLSDAQTKAAYHLGTSGRASVVIGAAGVGKTALYDVLIDAWHEKGLKVVGLTRAWRQTQALTDVGADHAHSIRQFLVGMEAGRYDYGKGHVVILDEISQVGTRDLLDISRLRSKHDFILPATGDHKQGGSIEAGHAVRLFELALGEDRVPELTWTRRQERKRDRETALLFRNGRAAEALERKREDGTMAIVPGGYKETVKAVVDLWFQRRVEAPDKTVGISAPTNADAMAIGAEIRRREQERGTIGPDRYRLEAIDQRGAEYELPVATGDRLRLFQRTWAPFSGGRASIVGNNGSVVTVETINDRGMHVRTAKGKVAWVEWDRLRDKETGRIKLSYGDALTIDARQGDTVDEHITALPAGSRAVHGLQAYVAASRHRQMEWFVTSQGEELADIEAKRPIGDPRNSVTARAKVEAFILDNMARNLRRQPEKTLATDFLETARRVQRGAVNAGKAFWHRPGRVEERQAVPIIQAVVEAAKSQQAAIAEAVEPWVARSNLDYWVSQWAKGWAEFEDIVDLEYAKRLERVQAAGVEDIDYGLLRDKASDDVKAAIQRYEAAEIKQERDQGRER
jgi:hypothetical protein